MIPVGYYVPVSTTGYLKQPVCDSGWCCCSGIECRVSGDSRFVFPVGASAPVLHAGYIETAGLWTIYTVSIYNCTYVAGH